MPTFPITVVFEIDAETEDEAHAILAEMLEPVFPVEALLTETQEAEPEQWERGERIPGTDPLLGIPGHEPTSKDTSKRGRRKH
jgi:hypothetical protein